MREGEGRESERDESTKREEKSLCTVVSASRTSLPVSRELFRLSRPRNKSCSRETPKRTYKKREDEIKLEETEEV